ncbi:MAG TPA: hypothetical protein VFJ58_06305 [Armatimonadota bacterium]|nr:hypothetical protein [Armatimonadota bacterium]
MNDKRRGARDLIDETVVFGILLIVLIIGLVVALIVRLVRQSRNWKRFRSLIRDWVDEREKRESQ